ncbi:MAG: hypothetical protein WAM73_05290 [Desulfobacterales bacterium]
MKMLITAGIAGLFLLSLPMAAAAVDFDGSKALLCSVVTVIESTLDNGCSQVSPESVALPQFLKVDFEQKIIRPAGVNDGDRTSVIRRMERMGGRLILQGADEGIRDVRESVGWTAAISEATGRFVVTASGEEEAFIVYGACIPLP